MNEEDDKKKGGLTTEVPAADGERGGAGVAGDKTSSCYGGKCGGDVRRLPG